MGETVENHTFHCPLSTILTDPTPFEQLLDEHLDALVLYAGLWNRSMAEDVVQDAFLKLLRLPEIPENPRPWLFRVVHNQMIDSLRYDRMRQQKLAQMLPERWFNPQPETETTAEELQAALKKLPEEQREIVVAKIWGELTLEEIAELTGSSRSRVHRDYHEALQQLRKLLEHN